MTKSAVIIAPFWRESGHVGNYRIERFIRWFNDAGIKVVLMRAGSSDAESQQSWGTELTIRDPLGFYRDPFASGNNAPPRKPNNLRRFAALWLFNPDAGVIWANNLVKHPTVLKYAANADFVLSSSRPESAHVASWRLANNFGCKLIVDMRDGWLDEPLSPLLLHSSIRRFLEARLEKKILARAERIFVTSDVWRELLIGRGVAEPERVTVITNAYPDFDFLGLSVEQGTGDGLQLLHTGRFRSSRSTQDPSLLLKPLCVGLSDFKLTGSIVLLGKLDANEQSEALVFEQSLNEIGWHLTCESELPRQQAFARIASANGLLLLCASAAAIPSKLFEYICARKPILIVTIENTAAWRVGLNIKQAVLLDYSRPETWEKAIGLFIGYLNDAELETNCPDNYSDPYLGELFVRSLGLSQSL